MDLLLCALLLLSPHQSQDTTPKQCAVTEVVTEGVRSDCGAWRPAKSERIFMPAEVSKALKVGDVFYFVWKETRWVAEIPASKPETVALVFGREPRRIEFMATDDAERLYAAIELKRVAGTNTAEDDRLHAALTQALGTIGYPFSEPDGLSPSEREMKRWQRAPLQKPDRGGN